MTNTNRKSEKRFYCSIIEFQKDFFPKSFGEKQAKKPDDKQSVGANLAKESFRKIRQEILQGKTPTSK